MKIRSAITQTAKRTLRTISLIACSCSYAMGAQTLSGDWDFANAWTGTAGTTTSLSTGFAYSSGAPSIGVSVSQTVGGNQPMGSNALFTLSSDKEWFELFMGTNDTLGNKTLTSATTLTFDQPVNFGPASLQGTASPADANGFGFTWAPLGFTKTASLSLTFTGGAVIDSFGPAFSSSYTVTAGGLGQNSVTFSWTNPSSSPTPSSLGVDLSDLRLTGDITSIQITENAKSYLSGINPGTASSSNTQFRISGLSAIPEPSAAAMLSILGIFAVLNRWRKQRP